MTSPIDPLNYSSPLGGQALAGIKRTNPAVPTFAKIVFIIDLVFSGVRLPLGLFGILGYQVLKESHSPLVPTIPFEIACALGVAVFGVTADILGLMRKPAAVWVGCLALLATLGSQGVGLWQVGIQSEQFPADSPQRVGFYIGAGFMLIFRLSIAAAYIAAIVQFAAWSRRQNTSLR